MDVSLFHLINSLAGHGRMMDAVIVFCAEYMPYALATLIFGVTLWRTRDWRMPLTALVSAAVARGVVKTVILLFYARPRPFVVLSGVHQLIAAKGEEYQSFPSGHALFFFAVAAAAYGYNRRLGWWLFAGATVMGIARVAAGVHWPSDILAGAILGIVTAAAILRFVPPLSPKNSQI
jgi:undecaprenyl-diphosphatase